MYLFSPNIAYASFDSFLANVNQQIINPLISFLFALAIIYFLYGVFQFISNQDSEEKKTTGKAHMIWGIIGITIMLGVWTILGIILSTFNIPKSEIDPETGTVDLEDYSPQYPQVGN
jgi:uncharacterized membrane protein YidH (DUF202 family)